MPIIAQGAQSEGALFYWHLGDFRAIYRIDQDYAATHAGTIDDYLAGAWQDFIDSQLAPFGDIPVFLALGNHETIPPKDRSQVLLQFSGWFNSLPIRSQRLLDDSLDNTVKGYYHWSVSGIDFVTLDNATPDQFDAAQMTWLGNLLARDAKDFSIRGLVVGMHEALPDSLSANHSMNQFPAGTASGRTVADWLVRFKQTTRKSVYVLASHSHFYMEGIFNTPAWRARGEVLPGWIVGTAGAERYVLPPDANDAKDARTRVYGYLVGTVDLSQDNPVQFEFRQFQESATPQDVLRKYTPAVVHDCWINNPVPQ